jgi:hypothetical protein
VSHFHRKISATLAGMTIAASALLAGGPAATADAAPQSYEKGHHKAYYKVEIEYIDCDEIEDKKGYDEIYLKWDDHHYWGYKNAYEGHRYWVKKHKDFKHDFKLSLWDHDYGPHDYEDDYLGHVWVKKHDYKKGWQYAEFDDHGGDYKIKYKVVKYWK